MNDFDDEVILFFEPQSPASREAAKRSHDRIAARTTDLGAPVPVEFAAALLGDRPKNRSSRRMQCPVENWYARNAQLPTLQLLTYPRAGHGPQHEHPEATAAHIATFLATTKRG